MRKLKDRMEVAGPLWKAMASRMDAIITSINELRSVVIGGQSPHKVNDTADAITLADCVDLDSAVDLAQSLITKYETHIGSSTYHLAADSSNVVTETGVPIEIYTLLNELKIDVNAHIVNDAITGAGITATYALLNELKTDVNGHIQDDAISSSGATAVYGLLNEMKTDFNAHLDNDTAHTNNDDVTTQASTTAAAKATAITLANELRAEYEAHRVLLLDGSSGAVHGLADNTNIVTVAALSLTATWLEIVVLTNMLRTKYEAHRVLTTGTVHAFADATNDVTASAIGAVLPHTNDDDISVQASSTAATKPTAIDLANELKTAYESHIAVLVDVGAQPVHGAADSTNTISLADLTSVSTWTDIVEMTNALRTAYEAHRILTAASVHAVADPTNAVSASAVGAVLPHTNDDDVTAIVSESDATSRATAIALANDIKTEYELHRIVVEDGDTNAVHGAADETNEVTLADLAVTATWAEISAMADMLRAKYEAHRVLTTSSVHAVADGTNTVSATAIGTYATAVYAGLNELKTDVNAHMAEFGTSHAVKDDSIVITASNATTSVTAVKLANAIKAAYNDHITRADSFGAIPTLDNFI